MISFLFWNINGKQIHDQIANLSIVNNSDVIILTECSIPTNVLLQRLNIDKKNSYHIVQNVGCKEFEIFTRFQRDFLVPIIESNRVSVRNLRLPGLLDINIAMVHFPSKLFWDDSSQSLQCVELSRLIKQAEDQIGHKRTLLVGDLNMNPFEDGVVSASGLHSVMNRSIAQKGSRVVQEIDHPFFYNPMWRFFGDHQQISPGTFYYEKAVQKNYFWNIFDQVLLRPDLLPLFDVNQLDIPLSDKITTFVTDQGVPDGKNISDHLPLTFKINL
jgi:hypothetical protein